MAEVVTDTQDGVIITGAPANVSYTFTLLGGKYGVNANDTGTTNVNLNMLAADQTNFLVLHTFAAPGYTTFDLPPGTYQFVFGSTGTSASAMISKVPYNPAY